MASTKKIHLKDYNKKFVIKVKVLGIKSFRFRLILLSAILRLASWASPFNLHVSYQNNPDEHDHSQPPRNRLVNKNF